MAPWSCVLPSMERLKECFKLLFLRYPTLPLVSSSIHLNITIIIYSLECKHHKTHIQMHTGIYAVEKSFVYSDAQYFDVRACWYLCSWYGLQHHLCCPDFQCKHFPPVWISDHPEWYYIREQWNILCATGEHWSCCKHHPWLCSCHHFWRWLWVWKHMIFTGSCLILSVVSL